MRNKRTMDVAARQPIDLFPKQLIWNLEVKYILAGPYLNLDELPTLNTLFLN